MIFHLTVDYTPLSICKQDSTTVSYQYVNASYLILVGELSGGKRVVQSLPEPITPDLHKELIASQLLD